MRVMTRCCALSPSLDSPGCRLNLCMSQRSPTTELLIVLSEAERQSLRAGLIEDDKVVTQMLVDIDVEEAKAEQESDHRQLSVRFASLLQP